MQVGTIKAGPVDSGEMLPAAEGALLWSMRAWVLARCRAEELQVEERIEAALDRVDAPDAGREFCKFMDAVERGGIRPVVVGPLCARRLTADERALLDVFTCVQSERAAEAAQHGRAGDGRRSAGVGGRCRARAGRCRAQAWRRPQSGAADAGATARAALIVLAHGADGLGASARLKRLRITCNCDSAAHVVTQGASRFPPDLVQRSSEFQC